MSAVPKRVFFFRPTLGVGGADRVTLTLLRQLDRARYAPALILLRREGELVDDVPADVPIHALGSSRLARAVPALTRLLRRERPDVLFSTSSASNIIAVVAHGLARSTSRLVLSERNALFRGRKHEPKKLLEFALKRLLYARADLVTTVSQGVADQVLADVGLDPARVAVVFNPMVDDADVARQAAEPVDHAWFHDGKPVVIACGRLVAQKDYPTLLEAFAAVHAGSAARLFVLGVGPLKAELEALAARRGLGDAVCFHGFDKNPFKYMARADLLMHASRAEGLPGALIQSMACGTPVVSTDCDYGPREVISRPGEDGFLVPVGDASALAAHALRLLGDDALRGRVGDAARASAARFGVAASLARYQRAIDDGPSAAGGAA